MYVCRCGHLWHGESRPIPALQRRPRGQVCHQVPQAHRRFAQPEGTRVHVHVHVLQTVSYIVRTCVYIHVVHACTVYMHIIDVCDVNGCYIVVKSLTEAALQTFYLDIISLYTVYPI